MSFQCVQQGQQHTLYTNRLILRLADPSLRRDCEQIIQTYTDSGSGQGGNERVGVASIEDVHYKNTVLGPRAEFCTLAPPPVGHYLLVFLRQAQTTGNDIEGDFVGMVGISFRREMPFPDLGWATFLPYRGQGYATEARQAAVKFWRDIVGVREICALTLDWNEKSQKLAERIGFVKAGTVEIYFGKPKCEEKIVGRGFVLPGMRWRDGLWIRPAIQRPDGWKAGDPVD